MEKTARVGRAGRGIAATGSALAVTATLMIGLPAPAAQAAPAPAAPALVPVRPLLPAIATPTARRGGGVEIIAHRGGIDLTPENTLASIRRAGRLGADAVEIDMLFTRDRKKAVIHDLTMNRTTNCTGRVDRKTWKQVRRCDAGAWYSRAFNNEKVPSLNAALRVAKSYDMRVYVHVKDVRNARDARSIVRALRNNGMNNNRVVVFASNGRILDRLDAAGVSPRNLGKLFGQVSGWNSKYRTLVPYNMAIPEARVRKAQRQGHRVVAVEGHPLGLGTYRGKGLNGYMVNRLGRLLG